MYCTKLAHCTEPPFISGKTTCICGKVTYYESLTGVEWYKRFEQEVHGTAVADGLECKEAALLLARRAAGIEDAS